MPVIQGEFQVALGVQPFKRATEKTNMTLKIEKDSNGKGRRYDLLAECSGSALKN
jgi:hypothetical protein